MIITKQVILRESPDMTECVRFKLRGVPAGTKINGSLSNIVSVLPWRIDFGDGTRQTLPPTETRHPTHDYVEAGDYDLVLYGRLTGVSAGSTRAAPLLGNAMGKACPGFKEAVFAADSPTAVIDRATFRACHELESVVLPRRLVMLGANVFQDCERLTEIDLPETITTIGAGAFQNCTGLTKFTIRALEPPEIDESVFTNVPRTLPIHVPAAAVDAYREAEVWREFQISGL